VIINSHVHKRDPLMESLRSQVQLYFNNKIKHNMELKTNTWTHPTKVTSNKIWPRHMANM